MTILVAILVVVLILALIALKLSIRVVTQYEMGVLFRLGRVIGVRHQGIITRDNVSVDISAVAYFHIVDAVKSVVPIENVYSAIDQIAQTMLRKVVGQHTLDEALSETDRINLDIREILDVSTVDWGVEVTLVELKDIQLPESMKRGPLSSGATPSSGPWPATASKSSPTAFSTTPSLAPIRMRGIWAGSKAPRPCGSTTDVVARWRHGKFPFR